MKYIKWVAIGLAVLFGVSVVGVLMNTVLFPAKIANTAINSAGNIVTKTLNADNVIHNYEWFYDTSGAIIARVGQINSHKSLVDEASDPSERSVLNMELAAMKQTCRELVTKYNVNSEKANRSLFKSNGLPDSYNLSTCEV